MKVIRRYTAAAIQYEPKFGHKLYNIKKLEEMSRIAAERAKLIVLPEMATTGYCFNDRDEIASYVEPIPGPTTELFGKISHEHSCYIVLSIPEIDQCSNNYFNTCVLIGPQGVVGKYRKTHLYASDTKWANMGNLGFPIFSTKIGKIGCLICNDLYFFEPARIMSLKGVDVICNPTNWGKERCPAPAWFSRAWENGVYLVSANRWGCERGMQCSGGSSIITPKGCLSNYIDNGNGIVCSTIDLASTRQNILSSGIHQFNDRKSKHYRALNLCTYLYNPYYTHRLYQGQVLPEGKQSVVAVYQYYPAPLKIEENINKIESAALTASREKVELLVLPELAITGNLYSKADVKRVAEPIPGGALLKRIATMADKYQIGIVLSLAEKKEDKYFITVVLVDGDGLKVKYQKIHLSRNERSWACTGEKGFRWVDLNLGRVGLLTGEDCVFPESTMCLATLGADIIAVPSAIDVPKPLALKATNLPLPSTAFVDDDPIHWHLWRTRSVETNTVIAFANQTGKGGMGNSGIFGPTDWPRNEKVISHQEGLLFYKLNTGSVGNLFPDQLVRVKENVRMRLPYLYDSLVI